MQTIIVGSVSPLKKQATKKGCSLIRFDAEIFTIPAESGQDAQPIGYDATRGGAYVRALQAQERDRKAIGIGIESGLVCEGGIWYDFTVVVAMIPGWSEPAEAISQKFAVPEMYVGCIREAEHRGFATTTLGDILHERYKCDPADLEAFFSDGEFSRVDIIAPAIAETLGQLVEA